MALQYHLIVKNGAVEKEKGFFFKARPFDIQTAGTTAHVAFKRGSKGKVVQAVSINGKLVEELMHPDYTPEAPITSVPAEQLPIYAALCRLGVCASKDYQKHFKAEDAPKYSYEVSQQP